MFTHQTKARGQNYIKPREKNEAPRDMIADQKKWDEFNYVFFRALIPVLQAYTAHDRIMMMIIVAYCPSPSFACREGEYMLMYDKSHVISSNSAKS